MSLSNEVVSRATLLQSASLIAHHFVRIFVPSTSLFFLYYTYKQLLALVELVIFFNSVRNEYVKEFSHLVFFMVRISRSTFYCILNYLNYLKEIKGMNM